MNGPLKLHGLRDKRSSPVTSGIRAIGCEGTVGMSKEENNMQELLDSQRKKLKERNNDLEAMMMALKEETITMTKALNTRIEELEKELTLYRAAVEEGVSSAAHNYKDVPRPKNFVGTMSTCDVDNFL
ncbi:hypothetical protein PVK06_043005 [Gossypium arboreum]|uniref:Uncharacterized protein n=1 Tax=Gossypium arboreum TaxID=29729 RepID=A0ABR0MMS2_GOSAR|nr:hypothetical protein PVK06_043005 [Gossypium arboreum]